MLGRVWQPRATVLLLLNSKNKNTATVIFVMITKDDLSFFGGRGACFVYMCMCVTQHSTIHYCPVMLLITSGLILSTACVMTFFGSELFLCYKFM